LATLIIIMIAYAGIAQEYK